jgi:branched-chain amino acid transport system permease protein
MGIAEVLVVGYISPTYRDAIAFILLIVILLVRPAGILGRNVAEKV